ncbi:hypothetical protein DsansV1_C01g0002241 [Dioscorea sansibarensis]
MFTGLGVWIWICISHLLPIVLSMWQMWYKRRFMNRLKACISQTCALQQIQVGGNWGNRHYQLTL